MAGAEPTANPPMTMAAPMESFPKFRTGFFTVCLLVLSLSFRLTFI